MREWWSKVRMALGGRRQLADDLRDETEAHLQLEIEERISTGMTPAQAQKTARSEFGNRHVIEERARESWMFYAFETALQDLRYGVRMLARSPVLAAAVILSLGLGIGANTGLFSVVNAVMLRVLPVSHPEQLILLTWSSAGWPEAVVENVEGSVDTDQATGRMTSSTFSYDAFDRLRGANTVLSATTAFSTNDERVNVGLGTSAQDAMMQPVAGNYFAALGVGALVGRTLLPIDERAGAPLAAVLSAGFWQKTFGGDASVPGRTIVINGQPATIVGVAPREFSGVDPGRTPDLYVPLTFHIDQFKRVYDGDLRAPKTWWLTIVGRMKPGMSQSQAAAELRELFGRSLGVSGGTAARGANMPALEVLPAGRGLNGLREEFSTSLSIMMAMVALVLLICCANVAGLLLARATARQKEISIRLSLGAPRLRIVRQLLTESLLLGGFGGAAGLIVASFVGSALAGLLAAAPRQPITLSIPLDARVFAFTAAISILSGILFGLAPAVRARRLDVYSTLRQTAGVPAAGGHRFVSGKILAGAQVALALLLLVAAGLLVRTLWQLQRVDLGFARDRLLLFDVQPGPNGYRGARLAAYYQDLQQRVAALPGVESAGISQRAPVGEGWSQGRVVVPGYTTVGRGVPFHRHWVSPGFFETLRIPLLLGRLPDARDKTTSPRVVVVNQTFVRRYLRGENPIGRRFDAGSLKAEIVGVVGDTRYGNLRDEPPPTAYFSYLQYSRDYPTSMTFEVRTQDDPRTVVPAIRAAAAALDKDLPLVRIRTLEEVIDRALFLERTFAVLSGSFGFLAAVLACIGLYGTMSYTVSRRTSEIGVRMALGAPRERIRAMVIRDALAVVLAGIAVGLPLAWTGARLLENRLFGLSPHDPRTILLATAALVVVTVTAAFLPALRASKVDPVIALRCE